jgi:SAM-dependent methyltransferase
LDERAVTETRRDDGSAGDVDYASIAGAYSSYRHPDPRIMAHIDRALGAARSVLNVGAGTGSYEPIDRDVTAVEPSATMRAQRPPHLNVAIDAIAEALPFDDDEFDASMATFTVHQWTHLDRGLAEMRRVTRGPVVILTCDPALVERFWLNDYAPQVLAAEARRYPPLHAIQAAVGSSATVQNVPIPFDCTDGFNEAYYGRPERLLDDSARLACSAWSFVPAAVRTDYVDHLRRDLQRGAWDSRYGALRSLPEYDGSLRLIVGHRDANVRV